VRAPRAIKPTKVESNTNVAERLQLVPVLGVAKLIV
jgi:hypothetical protein